MHFHTGGWSVDDAEPLGIPLRGPADCLARRAAVLSTSSLGASLPRVIVPSAPKYQTWLATEFPISIPKAVTCQGYASWAGIDFSLVKLTY